MSTPPTTTNNTKKRKAATTTNDVSNDERFPPSPSSYPKQQSITTTTTLPSHLLPLSHSSSHSHSKRTEPGLIYLSRLPPGMGPSKVKHLLQAYGEIGRVFLKRAGESHRGTVAPLRVSRLERTSERFGAWWIISDEVKMTGQAGDSWKVNDCQGMVVL